MQHLSSTVSMSATQALMPSRALHGCPWQVRLLASHPPPRAAVTSCARAPQISSTLTRVMCPGVARKGRLRSPSQRQQAVVLASSMASWSAVWNNTGPAWEIPLYIHAIRQFGPVLLAALGSIVCTKLLKHLSGRDRTDVTKSMEADDEANPRSLFVQVVDAAADAVYPPLKILLPLAVVVLSINRLGNWLDILLEVHDHLPDKPLGAIVPVSRQIALFLHRVGHVAWELSQLGCIIFGVWISLRVKEHMVKLLLQIAAYRYHPLLERIKDQADDFLRHSAFEQVALPLSSLASWVVVLTGVIMALQVMGINLAPLLTVGGFSGILVGLSAQSLLSNIISGFNLFLSRPFVVGDRVEISTPSGSKSIVGVVEKIEPMSTHLRTNQWLPIIVPNKVISEMIISNESRIARVKEVTYYNKMRVLEFRVTLRYPDFDLIEDILTKYKKFVKSNVAVDTKLPIYCTLSALTDIGCQIYVRMHTKPYASREFTSFRMRMLLAFGKTVRQAGADFAYVRQVSVVPASQMVGRPAPSEHTGAEMANGHSSSGANGAGGSVYNDADVIAALSELAARPGQLASGAASGAVAPISSVQN